MAEVESRLYKTFTNMAVRPMGPRRHWVVVGSFTPRPLLWDSELSSTRVKRFLLKSDFRFSKILSPGEPLTLDDRLLHHKNPKILSEVFPETLVPTGFTIPYHRYTLMDNYLQLPFIPSFSVALVITRCPKLLSVVPKIL